MAWFFMKNHSYKDWNTGMTGYMTKKHFILDLASVNEGRLWVQSQQSCIVYMYMPVLICIGYFKQGGFKYRLPCVYLLITVVFKCIFS